MQLRRLEAKDFRCLEGLVFEPAPGLNVIRGDNAQGKTTVLEAILYAATSKSHRSNSENDLVRFGEEGFHLKLHADRVDRPVELEAHCWRGQKRVKVNGIAQTRLSDLLGRVNVVFFSPEDGELVRGGAGSRRRFLDMELSQINPPYLNALQRYRQALRQRNELLRRGKDDPDMLSLWDAQLVEHGAVLIEMRQAFIEELSEEATRAHASIAEGEAMLLSYSPDVRTADTLAAALEKSRASDLRRGNTQRGPHRDDMEILIADRPARSYGSQGQQKTAVLALKLAEVALVKARTGEYPVLLLDEVLAELDAHRSRQLLEAIAPEVQCVMTSTELHHRAEAFCRPCACHYIEGGRLAQTET